MPVTAVISSVNPVSGMVGTHVQITGSNFVQGGIDAVVVFSNNVNATSVFSYTSTQIIVAVPTGAVTGTVYLEFPGGNSNSKPFTVTAPLTPNISSLSPSNGGVGISVSVNGTNFGPSQGSSTITVNGLNATVNSWSATLIKITIPAMATTGPVIVTVGGLASNSVTFTVTNPSYGGTGAPLGMLLIPAQQFTTQSVFTFEVGDFNDDAIGSFYNYKVEEVLPGRTPTCSRQFITYRDLGIATITATLIGTLSPMGDTNTPSVVSTAETFQIGTSGATGKLFTILRTLTLTAQNLQYTITRQPAAGPVSITRTRLEGRVELTPYA
jgi:IPT/TIG domain